MVPSPLPDTQVTCKNALEIPLTAWSFPTRRRLPRYKGANSESIGFLYPDLAVSRRTTRSNSQRAQSMLTHGSWPLHLGGENTPSHLHSFSRWGVGSRTWKYARRLCIPASHEISSHRHAFNTAHKRTEGPNPRTAERKAVPSRPRRVQV